jgi:hypothetical protein
LPRNTSRSIKAQPLFFGNREMTYGQAMHRPIMLGRHGTKPECWCTAVASAVSQKDDPLAGGQKMQILFINYAETRPGGMSYSYTAPVAALVTDFA